MPFYRTLKELEEIMDQTRDYENNVISQPDLEQIIIRVTGAYGPHLIEQVFKGLMKCQFVKPHPKHANLFTILRRSFSEKLVLTVTKEQLEREEAILNAKPET